MVIMKRVIKVIVGLMLGIVGFFIVIIVGLYLLFSPRGAS